VSYNTADGSPSVIYLQFIQEQERSRWYTYLNYLKERLQYKQFVEKFNDIPDIRINQGTPRQLKEGPHDPQVGPRAAPAGQGLQSQHIGTADEEATLKSKIVQALRKADND